MLFPLTPEMKLQVLQLFKQLTTWNLDIEMILQQLRDNISQVVACQEKTRMRVTEFHGSIDAEADKILALILAAREEAHEAIESHSKLEMDYLQGYLNASEKYFELFQERSNELTRSLASFNADSSLSWEPNDDIKFVKLNEIKAQSYFMVKDIIASAREHVLTVHNHKVVGSVRVSEIRCDNLQAFLRERKLFSVSNDIFRRCPIPHNEDAMVLWTSIFERRRMCEACCQSYAEKDPSACRSHCSTCDLRFGLQQHTINREAGVIDGRGSSAEGEYVHLQGVTLLSTSSDKLLFVGNTTHHSLQVYDSETGQYLRSLTAQFNSPYQLTTLIRKDKTQLLFVSDWGDNCVHIIDVSHGDVVKGSIAVDDLGGLAVMECHVNGAITSCLYTFSSDQVYVYDVDTMKQVNVIGTGLFDRPRGLALLPSFMSEANGQSNSRLFVCDFGHSIVQVFDALSGSFLSTIGAALLRMPWGAAVSLSYKYSNHMLIITEFDQRKLFLFDAITGASVRVMGSYGAVMGSSSHSMCEVAALRDDNDRIVLYMIDNQRRIRITVI